MEEGVVRDFLGQEYGPGDLVIYGAHSGRSINMVVGRVVDVIEKYYDINRFKWVPVPPDGVVPKKYRGKDSDIKTSVVIQPLRASRWEQHRERTYYTDRRSGKRINPDAPSGRHVLKESHYVYADGTEFDYAAETVKWEQRHNNVYGRINRDPFEYYFRKTYHVSYGEPGSPPRFPLSETEAAKTQLWWVRRTYQPWVVEHAEEPKAVSIDITDNIVKWNGELPDDAGD
jgi:hypothetical protein